MCVSLARARSSRRSVPGFMLVLLLRRLRLALGGDAVALVVAGKFCALSWLYRVSSRTPDAP